MRSKALRGSGRALEKGPVTKPSQLGSTCCHQCATLMYPQPCCSFMTISWIPSGTVCTSLMS